ncbi:MAG: methylated-DNA--[protein]-cysteine S-methyltransferase [Desulfatirhabdiaceae bacterium]
MKKPDPRFKRYHSPVSKQAFGPENPLLFKESIPTSFGNAGLIYQASPFRLKEILLPGAPESHPYPTDDITVDPVGLQLIQFIQNYFKGLFPGDPMIFWDCLDFGRQTRLQIQVLQTVAAIPYGEIRSYKDIAESIGRPGSARFIGNTMAQNPFPVLIPCHRVIRSNGSMGGFGGGIDLKIRMLDMERLSEDRGQKADD